MNKELQGKIVEYLQKTESFIASEAPAFIQEAINFYFYKELVAVIGCLTVLLLILYSARFILSEKYRRVLIDLDCPDPKLFQKVSLIFPYLAIFITTLESITCFVNFMQICIAPRLYLLERLVG